MKKLTLRSIEREVCKFFDCMPEDLWIKSRQSLIIERRQLFHYFAFYYSSKTNKEIGGYKGKNYDRNTVYHSIKVVKDRKDTEKEYRINFLEIKHNLDTLLKNKIDINDIMEKIELYKAKIIEYENLLKI